MHSRTFTAILLALTASQIMAWDTEKIGSGVCQDSMKGKISFSVHSLACSLDVN